MSNTETEKISIMGLPVDRVCMEEALEIFDGFLDSDHFNLIVTANPEILDNALSNEALAEIIRKSPLVIPDGIGLLYAARIKGKSLKERVTGIDFTHEALKHAALKGKTAYFLGSKPGVAQSAAENIMKEIDGLVVAGARDGYFKAEEEESVVEEINRTGADFLCVALGSPKQELFMEKYSERLCCRAGVGIGGSLDVWSGNTKRAPEFYIKHNLEWFYRLASEPGRIGRVAKIPVFLLKVLFDRN